jgi:hypothetical protein
MACRGEPGYVSPPSMASPKKSEAKVVPIPGDPEVNAAAASGLGLSESELSRASKELGRSPTYAELAVLGALWSERESQKSARVHARRLPSKGPHVVRGLDDSAGAVDLGDGYCAVFTLESRDTGDAATAAPSATCSPPARVQWPRSMRCASARRTTKPRRRRCAPRSRASVPTARMPACR